MSKNISTTEFQSKLDEYLATRKIDFRNESNTKQDWKGIAQAFADKSVSMWGSKCRGEGFTSDSQLGAVSLCALTAVQTGFYMKPPKSKQFADGTLVTLTDRGVHPGDRRIETNTVGSRYNPKDDGITGPDEVPERSVTRAEDMVEQNFHPVRDKAVITLQQLAEANKRGYDAFEEMGELLRRAHDQNLNKLIREGNVGAKLTGMTNHPGIRRYSASADWGSDSADVVWDDYRTARSIMFASDTQEGYPGATILPAVQYDYFEGEQFSLASDKTLLEWVEGRRGKHDVVFDHGMNGVDSNGNPGALMYTNRQDLLRVTMPYWLRMHEPFQVDELKIRIMIESRYAGVQVSDVDTLLLVEGTAAGWEQNP